MSGRVQGNISKHHGACLGESLLARVEICRDTLLIGCLKRLASHPATYDVELKAFGLASLRRLRVADISSQIRSLSLSTMFGFFCVTLLIIVSFILVDLLSRLLYLFFFFFLLLIYCVYARLRGEIFTRYFS